MPVTIHIISNKMENKEIVGNIVKHIVITEYLKFQYTDKKGLVYENAYRSGYWNVFKQSPELEKFLNDNEIKFVLSL